MILLTSLHTRALAAPYSQTLPSHNDTCFRQVAHDINDIADMPPTPYNRTCMEAPETPRFASVSSLSIGKKRPFCQLCHPNTF